MVDKVHRYKRGSRDDKESHVGWHHKDTGHNIHTRLWEREGKRFVEYPASNDSTHEGVGRVLPKHLDAIEKCDGHGGARQVLEKSCNNRDGSEQVLVRRVETIEERMHGESVGPAAVFTHRVNIIGINIRIMDRLTVPEKVLDFVVGCSGLTSWNRSMTAEEFITEYSHAVFRGFMYWRRSIVYMKRCVGADGARMSVVIWGHGGDYSSIKMRYNPIERCAVFEKAHMIESDAVLGGFYAWGGMPDTMLEAMLEAMFDPAKRNSPSSEELAVTPCD